MRARRTLQTATRIMATDTPTRRALCSTGGTDNGPGGSPRHQRRRALGGSLGRTMTEEGRYHAIHTEHEAGTHTHQGRPGD